MTGNTFMVILNFEIGVEVVKITVFPLNWNIVIWNFCSVMNLNMKSNKFEFWNLEMQNGFII